MKILRRIATALVVLALLGSASCSKGPTAKKDSNVDYWTCTMHPSVHSKDPGKCPICSMDLVPVMKKGVAEAQPSQMQGEQMKGGEMKGMSGMPGMPGMKEGEMKGGEKPGEFVVPVERQQQIGVRYARVERKPLRHTIRAVGLIVPDRSRNWQFVSRVDGYVQKLNVTSPGEIVEKDAPLMSIYSPDLLTSEREFVELLRMRDQAKSKDARETPQRLIESARRRLQLWNVMPEQVAELEKTRKASDTLTLLSPFRGVVQSVPVEQGKSVKVGDMLVEVADLSVVWLWAEFYENELSMLQVGQKLAITAKSYPGQNFDGTIALIDPFINETKRTAKVRIDIPNPDFKLRPGMYVNAELAMDMGEALTVPVSAIMPTGDRNVVFVDKGEGKLEPRIVQLGSKYGDIYEVQSGLQEGERVVASANFLIDAESKVQGALKEFERPEKTGETEAGKQGEQESAKAQRQMPKTGGGALPQEAQALYQPLVTTYLAIHDQLAHDKFDRVADQAGQMRQQLAAIMNSDIKPEQQADVYRQRIDALSEALEKFKPANIEEARVQFGHVSAEFISLIEQCRPPLSEPLYVIKCPMWKKSPAQWLQKGKQIQNPFLGQAMPTCGEQIKAFETAK